MNFSSQKRPDCSTQIASSRSDDDKALKEREIVVKVQLEVALTNSAVVE